MNQMSAQLLSISSDTVSDPDVVSKMCLTANKSMRLFEKET
jgi:hypothetical protein